MKLIFLGAPGAGKGTYSFRIKDEMNVAHISTGDLLRENVDHGEYGGMIKETMSEGKLFPDELMASLLLERLSKDDCSKGFILDGFPRTVRQAEILAEKGIEVDKVVQLDVNEETVLNRLSGRHTCTDCKKLYNVNTGMLPKQEGKCDDCGAELFQREDDKEDTIKKRLAVYHESTKPLIEFYENKGKLIKHDSNREVSVVIPELIERLKE
jgi:adenylate kinase